ncbi:ComEC/Rec2 family competence protein [Candidatus Peregrinibacteria bacterium]|nr:ComEC/Rec2 family competence protein [Candidatus Peregrinibacteria bacterium]
MSLIFFTTTFIATTFLLQWWIRPSYPLALWIILGCVGSIGCLPLGKLRAFGGGIGSFWLQRNLAARAAARCGSDSSMQACLPAGRRALPIFSISCTLGLSLALWNVARTERALRDSLQRIPWNTNVQIEGMVKGLPKSQQETITYTVAVRTVTQDQERHPARGTITVHTRDITSKFIHGDIVHITGSIERIPPPYDTYFRAQNILGSISYATITGTGKRGGSILSRTLAYWNRKVTTRIRDIVPEPEASLLAGLLLGETGGFQKETLTAFRTAGLSHILAVSGYNITLLLIALSVLTARLPSFLRLMTALIGITLFTLFVGGSPSAMRAALMGSLGLLALHTRHLPETRRTMLFTAFLMLLWNPRQLWWDASFQLSFLAVIGITELQPALKKFLQRVPDALGIRETLTVTLAAQCTALPWASALFGNFPLFSPIANILVAPVIPFIMLTGPIALFGGILNDSLGRILAFPCWVALQWIVRVAEIIASLPLASLPFPKNAGLPLLLYYGALLVFLLQKKYRIRNSLRKL